MPSLLTPARRVVAGVGVSLLLAGAPGCGPPAPKTPKPKFTCPSKLSKALAFAHLKEAFINLETMTVKAAEEAIVLTTDGLSCAPPHGSAQASTVARLLVIRARASAALDFNEASLADLKAALLWAEQGKKDDPLLVPEIHLAMARLFLRVQDHEAAARSAAEARAAASRLGKAAAGIQCEALLLEGDLANRRAPEKYPPEGYFRRIFEVAQRYDYPEDVWPHMEGAISRLELSAQDAQSLMGPVPALRERQIADAAEARVRIRRDAPSTPDTVRMSSGSISGADQTVASMRAGFRDCYRRSLSDSPQGGRAVLTISVGSNGAVEHVAATTENMDAATVACLTAEAQRAQFNPPDTDHAVLNVPVTFVQQ